MKKIIIFVFSIMIAIIGCDRHPLYIPEDSMVNIKINVIASIDSLWCDGWRDSLKYDWNEEKHGIIGYSIPKEINGIFISDENVEHNQKLEIDNQALIPISAQKTYDILLYNQSTTTYTERIGKEFFISSMTNKHREGYEYDIMYEPNELFSSYIEKIDFSKQPYEIIYGDKQTVLYHINAVLKPISYIYIIQFIVQNDDNSDMIEAKEVEWYILSGVSSKKSLITAEPICDYVKGIYSNDVKEGQLKNNSLIFASRITVMDLFKGNSSSSWEYRDAYYVLFNLKTLNYGDVYVSANVTSQMYKNPYGGIITIYLKNSQLKSVDDESNKFDVIINDWIEHIYDL